MAIGSLDRAGRLDQLRTFADVQVRAGYRSLPDIKAEVREAVAAELKDADDARRVAGEYVDAAAEQLAAEQAGWPQTTGYDVLRGAFAELERADVVVLESCDDHWVAHGELERRAAEGRRPRGVAFFTPTDVWHAVQHRMLEVNVWHGDSANVLDTDPLLADVIATFERHGLPAHFDEGRIEVTVDWQRRRDDV
jgi:hypothetical protein